MKKYKQIQSGEGQKFDDETTVFLACCDCGLVHAFQFHKKSNKEWDMVIFRMNRRTASLRRYEYGSLQNSKNTGKYMMIRK